jgi:hypothetical protein
MNEDIKLQISNAFNDTGAATLEMVCNILNNCEWTLDGCQDPEYLLTSERFIQAVVEKYHTNKR